MADLADIRRRTAARIAQVVARPKIPAKTFATHDGYASPGAARAACTAAVMPKTSFAAIRRPADGRYVPVIVLRLDQVWMRERLEERGLVVLDTDQQAAIIAAAGL